MSTAQYAQYAQQFASHAPDRAPAPRSSPFGPFGPPTLFPSESDSSRLSPRELGREGERIAAEYLRVAGFRVVDRNWRWRGPDVRGELDIVAIDGDVLVSVEVKTRRAVAGGGGGPGRDGVGRPLDAVTDAKRTRLWRLANRWLAEHRHDPDFRRNCPGSVRGVRLDVVGLLFPADGRTEPLLDHLRAV